MGRRKRKLANDINTLMQQYKRKAHPKQDPNDRHYDREVERRMKKLKPQELDELLNGDPYEDGQGTEPLAS